MLLSYLLHFTSTSIIVTALHTCSGTTHGTCANVIVNCVCGLFLKEKNHVLHLIRNYSNCHTAVSQKKKNVASQKKKRTVTSQRVSHVVFHEIKILCICYLQQLRVSYVVYTDLSNIQCIHLHLSITSNIQFQPLQPRQ